ncbi:bifunctional 3-(3-hydroxy-phenyl)propionate/3-hydroxycinnamic acid hydroxylase MhpA [Lysinibacillus capsici]|uniref:bifunctional 3-(3-hydroxy-phenyl)propionate/3-hydroxycinnamic acid hydroxylase MhpA n=1 Tax=Lysinibacillus capsici TaxID=2115968 RepID=UPI0036A6AF6D
MVNNEVKEFDVAIIGYGPVGATLANYLGKAGLSVGVFEREPSVFHMPRASHLDGEIMRCYQAIDLAEQIEKVTIETKGYDFVNGEGKVILKLDKEKGLSPHSWNYHYRYHQPTFESILRSGVDRYKNVYVFLNHEVDSCEQNSESTTLHVKNLQQKQQFKVKAKYLVGCDGARSMVRNSINSEMEDIGQHQQWLVIDVKLNNPVDNLPKKGIQYCDPKRPITYIPGIGEYDRHRWEIMLMPGDDKDEMEKHESVWKLLNKWIKPEDAVIERASVYKFHSLIATGWRKGRILLAGDSVHQTPPFLGQGMCAGVRDVANLAWKLVMVLNNKAPENILDTYETERKHHVKEFIKMASDLGKIITITDPIEVKERDNKFLSEEPKELVEPNPTLGKGLHGDSPFPAGSIFPQPKLPDGQLLDNKIGTFNFAIIGKQEVIYQANETSKDLWEQTDSIIITNTSIEIDKWLEKHNCKVVIIRPDRYILGTALDANELNQVSLLIPSHAIV